MALSTGIVPKASIALAPMPAGLRLQLRRLLKKATGIEIVAQAFSWDQLRAMVAGDQELCILFDEALLSQRQFLEDCRHSPRRGVVIGIREFSVPLGAIANTGIQSLLCAGELEAESDDGGFAQALVAKIFSGSNRADGLAMRTGLSASEASVPLKLDKLLRPGKFDVLAIGASTGGPPALNTLLKSLAGGIHVPVVITQHMGQGFTAALARSIQEACAMPAAEAQGGERLEPGRIYVAPGGRHLKIEKRGEALFCRLDDGPPQCFCKPSVDVMLQSLADIPAVRSLVVMLTGMGQDGLEGAKQIKAGGGSILAQDQQSSVVWGMPGAVANARLCDAVLPLNHLGAAILKILGNEKLHG